MSSRISLLRLIRLIYPDTSNLPYSSERDIQRDGESDGTGAEYFAGEPSEAWRDTGECSGSCDDEAAVAGGVRVCEEEGECDESDGSYCCEDRGVEGSSVNCAVSRYIIADWRGDEAYALK